MSNNRSEPKLSATITVLVLDGLIMYCWILDEFSVIILSFRCLNSKIPMPMYCH